MRNRILFDESSEYYSTNYVFLKKNYIGLMMWSLTYFDDTRQNEGVKGTYSLQASTGGSCTCNQAQQEKGTFQRREIYKHDPAQQWLKKGSVYLAVLNSHKERTAQIPPPPPTPPHFKRGGPRTLKTAPLALYVLDTRNVHLWLFLVIW